MKGFLLMPAAALVLSAGFMATSANAAPLYGQQSYAKQSIVETVGRRCTRVCKGWGFKRRCKSVCRDDGHRHHHH